MRYYGDGDDTLLYRESQKVTLSSGAVLDYYEPGVQQLGFLQQFYIEGFKNLLFTPEELNKMKHSNLMEKSMVAFENMQKNMSEKEQALFLGQAVTNPLAMDALQRCMSECFPNINIKLLKTNVFMELTGILQSTIMNQAK